VPLSSQAIDGVFGRLAIRYGSAWFAKWDGIPIEMVKADWSEQLERLGVAAITHGLLNLPEYPPSVTEFKAICFSKPEPQQSLPPPKRGPLPPEVAQKIKPLVDAWRTRKPLQWAYDLQERERLGDDLSITQRAAWRAVLQQQMDTTIVGAFSQIPEHLHPPGGLRAEP
jgi:hypothetical protein